MRPRISIKNIAIVAALGYGGYRYGQPAVRTLDIKGGPRVSAEVMSAHAADYERKRLEWASAKASPPAPVEERAAPAPVAYPAQPEVAAPFARLGPPIPVPDYENNYAVESPAPQREPARAQSLRERLKQRSFTKQYPQAKRPRR